MAKHLKTTNNQPNETINNEQTFDTNSFNLSSGTSNSLLVLVVSLRVGKNIEKLLFLV